MHFRSIEMLFVLFEELNGTSEGLSLTQSSGPTIPFTCTNRHGYAVEGKFNDANQAFLTVCRKRTYHLKEARPFQSPC